MSKLKHIVVSEKNYDSLKKLGHAGDSFNDVLTQILSNLEGAKDGSRTGAESRP